MSKNKSFVSRAYINHMMQSDALMNYNITLYDNLPYDRDSDLCNLDYLISYGSQIIQRYRYDTEPYLLYHGNH